MSQLTIHKQKFNPAQVASLEQRLTLLNAFLEPQPKNTKSAKRSSLFAPGQLTIVDLSDPFLDAASACGLFEIIVRLFIRADVGTGKVLVVDEAHKVCVSLTLVNKHLTLLCLSRSTYPIKRQLPASLDRF